MINQRNMCYNCYRPLSSCMCQYITPLKTNTQFILLMHPKESRKTKNGTGHLTNLSLTNSKIFVGIDFTQHQEINTIINNPNNNCYVLYPDANAIELNKTSLAQKSKKSVIFIIDSTWACSKKMLRQSKNLQRLPKVSFSFTQASHFAIKTQPCQYALSTIESTQSILRYLCEHKEEQLSQDQLDNFLAPFHKMVEYQLECAKDTQRQKLRYKKPTTKL